MTLAGTERPVAGPEPAASPPRRPWRLLTRTWSACAILLLFYVALSFANDPRGYLGDTGSKVATLRAMAENGGLDPDVGYWAEQWDPDGALHPLFDTHLRAGKWISVTTLPAIYLASPLFRLAGYRGALLVPMAGAVLAALAARALARRLGGGEGWGAFWAVGLASPLTIYALDFWEHSLGVALIAWACVFLYDLVDGDRRWFVPVAAGLLFGAAATMRTEAFVYGAVATAVALVAVLSRTRRLAVPVLAGIGVLVGLAVPLAANLALERAVIGSDVRGSRAAVTVTSAGPGELGTRADEAALTTLAIEPGAAREYLLGAVLLLLLVAAASRAGDGDSDGDGDRPGRSFLVRFAAVGAASLYLLRFAAGLGFVPGMVAATPLVAAGLVWAWRGTQPGSRLVAAFALAPLPLVWATQYTGGMQAQWAGRYVLPTGTLLMVLGIVSLPHLRRAAQVALLSMAVAVTAFGVGWLSLRSHDIGRAGAVLASRPEPVVVARITTVPREYGWYVGHERWLTAGSAAEVQQAADLVRDAGFDRFALVDFDGEPQPAVAGFAPTAVGHVPFVKDVELRVTTFVKTA